MDGGEKKLPVLWVAFGVKEAGWKKPDSPLLFACWNWKSSRGGGEKGSLLARIFFTSSSLFGLRLTSRADFTWPPSVSLTGGGERGVDMSRDFPLGRGREAYVSCFPSGVDGGGSDEGWVLSENPLKTGLLKTWVSPTFSCGALVVVVLVVPTVVGAAVAGGSWPLLPLKETW